MTKLFNKIHKDALQLTKTVAEKDFKNLKEEDLDALAEAIVLLNDAYEVLYDEVFVEVEE